MHSRNNKWYWSKRKKVLETLSVKRNFVMNVNSKGNDNICEALIIITSPCTQTIMRHNMNKFNLTQFECRIQIYITYWWIGKKSMCFSASVILNVTNQSPHHLGVIFFFFVMMCTFSSIFRICLLLANILEESNPHW